EVAVGGEAEVIAEVVLQNDGAVQPCDSATNRESCGRRRGRRRWGWGSAPIAASTAATGNGASQQGDDDIGPHDLGPQWQMPSSDLSLSAAGTRQCSCIPGLGNTIDTVCLSATESTAP